MNRIIIGVVLVAFGVGGTLLLLRGTRSGGGGATGNQIPVAGAAACTPASPDEQCPPESWLADWDRLQSLNVEIGKEQQSAAIQQFQARIDSSLGMNERLAGQMPLGFKYDPPTRKFRRYMPPPPAPPAVATPTAPKGSGKK